MWGDWQASKTLADDEIQIDRYESQLFPVSSSSVLAPRMNDANGSLSCYMGLTTIHQHNVPTFNSELQHPCL